MKKLSLYNARILAKEVAKGILSKKVAPFDGAMRIWKDIVDNMEGKVTDDLWTFKSNASAIEDCKWNAENGGANADELIRQCEREILDAAEKLIEED